MAALDLTASVVKGVGSTMGLRVRLAVVLIAALLVCLYGLLWNLSVVYYYSMLSDPTRLADELIAPSARILGNVLLLPFLAGAYFVATTASWTRGRVIEIVLKQACLLVIFALLVRPILFVACYVLKSSGVNSLDAIGDFMDIPSWMSTALNYSLVYALGLFLVLGFLMFARYRHEQLQAVAMRSNWLQARLESLRAHLHPHFMFNTLNTISSLVVKEPEQARDLISELAALLRDDVSETDSEFCTLGRESEMAGRYLRIIGVRFGKRFRYDMTVPNSLKSQLVPCGLILTLVENAVTHGVSMLAGDCSVSMNCSKSGESLRIEVRNGYDPLVRSLSDRRGGLAVLGTRLQVLYGDAYRLDSGGDGAATWRAVVMLPALDVDAGRVTEGPANERGSSIAPGRVPT